MIYFGNHFFECFVSYKDLIPKIKIFIYAKPTQIRFFFI